MSKYIFNEFGASEAALEGQKLNGTLATQGIETFEIALATPKVTHITVTYGASRLLSGTSEPPAGMKTLIVKNIGRIAARLGESSGSAIYEKGLLLEPGETRVFKAIGQSVPKIYGRSTGFSTVLEVIEA